GRLTFPASREGARWARPRVPPRPWGRSRSATGRVASGATPRTGGARRRARLVSGVLPVGHDPQDALRGGGREGPEVPGPEAGGPDGRAAAVPGGWGRARRLSRRWLAAWGSWVARSTLCTWGTS